jgi:hypothetical protein
MTFITDRPVRLISFLATAGALLLCGCSHAAETASSTRKVEVTDPHYQMTAYSLEVPANWKFGGAILRQSDACHTTGGQLKYTMLAPDGTSAVITMPGAVWNWSADPLVVSAMVRANCLPNDIHSAANFLVNIAVPIIHPNAKIISVLPLTPQGQASVAAQLKSRLQQTSGIGGSRAGVPAVKWNIDGARVRIEYSQNGNVVEEQLQSIIDCNETQGVAMPRQQAYLSRHCSARNIYIVRAPKGHLDELLASALLENHNKSIQANNEWAERTMRDQWAAVKQAEAQSNAAFKQRMAANAQQFQAMVQQGKDFQNQQQASFASHMAAAEASSDARQNAAHQQANLSLNQADFTDPNTGQKVTASNQYAHQWMSSDNSTLLQTNDPFDPNRSVTTNPASTTWTEITPDR